MSLDDRDLLTLSDTELDLRLGEALYADDFGAKAPTDADKLRRAEHWFAAQRARLQQAVCTQSFVKNYVSSKDAVERELFDAVLAAVAAMAGLPVPGRVLAAKIVRYGITNLCPRSDAPADAAR
jgi:hypothetical protein